MEIPQPQIPIVGQPQPQQPQPQQPQPQPPQELPQPPQELPHIGVTCPNPACTKRPSKFNVLKTLHQPEGYTERLRKCKACNTNILTAECFVRIPG